MSHCLSFSQFSQYLNYEIDEHKEDIVVAAVTNELKRRNLIEF